MKHIFTMLPKTVLFACATICLFALVLNTYVLLGFKKTLNLNGLRFVVHNEMSKLMDQLKYDSIGFDIQPDENFGHGGNVQSKPNDSVDNSDMMPLLLQKNLTPSFVLGAGRKGKVSVVIGVPSIKRGNISYLILTLESLVRRNYPIDEDDTSIVVFIAEEDKEYVKTEARHIYGNFTREIDSGLIQVFGPPAHFYPNFEKLPRNFGDSATRVQWRSKEVIDAALLMYLCRHKAEYYLMMEDDVIVNRGYITTIKKFAAERSFKPYTYLSFSSFESIGKLIRTSDIPKWVSYLLTFYYEKPIDWLMNDYLKILNCNGDVDFEKCRKNIFLNNPRLPYPLLQHIGRVSSLSGKVQKYRDKGFKTDPVTPIKHKNPTTEVSTSLTSSYLSDARSWYHDNAGMIRHFFVPLLDVGDWIVFKFASTLEVKRIFIRTGTVAAERQMRFCSTCADLEVLPAMESSPKLLQKENFEFCASSDAQGNIECKPPVSIFGFRLKSKTKMGPIWFDIIYVKT